MIQGTDIFRVNINSFLVIFEKPTTMVCVVKLCLRSLFWNVTVYEQPRELGYKWTNNQSVAVEIAIRTFKKLKNRW